MTTTPPPRPPVPIMAARRAAAAVPDLRPLAGLIREDGLTPTTGPHLLRAAARLLDLYRDATGRHALADLALYEALCEVADDGRLTREAGTAYRAMQSVVASGAEPPSCLLDPHVAQAEADAAVEFLSAQGFIE